MKKIEIIDLLRKKIGGCFGDQDKLFARHYYDEIHAKELRTLAKNHKITLAEVQDIILGYLFRSGCHPDHIMKEVIVASDFFKKKLG